jgi:hypothetical protein
MRSNALRALLRNIFSGMVFRSTGTSVPTDVGKDFGVCLSQLAVPKLEGEGAAIVRTSTSVTPHDVGSQKTRMS